MWKYFGVICNVITVLLGSGLGLILRSRAGQGRDSGREKLPDVMMVCLGFCTVFAAASGLIGVENGVQAIIVVFSMAAVQAVSLLTRGQPM